MSNTQFGEDFEPIPLPDYKSYSEDEMRARAQAFYEHVKRRHTVRDFSDKSVRRDMNLSH